MRKFGANLIEFITRFLGWMHYLQEFLLTKNQCSLFLELFGFNDAG
jgi:hypothetical protein